MPAVRAERLCPNATFVAPDFARYRAVSRSVQEIFKRHTDLIEPLSLDEAYLDVTQNKTGLPSATLVACTIREQIHRELNLTASAGVAPNKFLPKLASDWRKPDGLFVIQPEDKDAFLLPLPVGRLPGVGKVTGEKLAKLGIQTVGDLRGPDLFVLEHEFGRYGRRLHELARGSDDSEVIPDRPTQSISVEDTFEQDVLLAETEPMIRHLAEKLWSASRKESRIARTVVLKLKTNEFKILTRSHTPDSPPASCDEVTEIALRLRDRVALGPRQRYRLVGVGLSNFFGMFAEKTSMGALIGAKVAFPPGPAAGGSAATTKTVRPDGTIELRYPDGTVKTKKLKQCGWDTTYPDGRFQPAECVRMEAIPAQVPSLPSDPVQSNWLDWESRALLSIIQGIFGGQTAGFANYQSNYESGNMDVYNLIMIRTVAVDQLSHTP